jgi:branched-chain amino acid transport system substrate-binding protein
MTILTNQEETKMRIIDSIKLYIIISVVALLTLSNAKEVFSQEMTSGVTDKTIEIGMTTPITGPSSTLGEIAVRSATLAIDEVNNAGGIHGRKINLIIQDDSYSGEKAISAVKKLIYRDKVFAILGPTGSSPTLAFLPTIKEAGVPHFAIFASSSKITDTFSKYVFQTLLPSGFEWRLMIKHAVETLKAKKIAFIHQSDEYGTIGADTGINELKKYNLESIDREVYQIGDTDFSSQILKLKRVNPDVTIIAGIAREASIILRQAKELGLKTQFFGGAGANAGLIYSMIGEVAEGYLQATMANVQALYKSDFAEKFRKKYPKEAEKPGVPSDNDLMVYSSTLVMIEGLKRAGKDLTKDKFISALETLRDFETEVAAPFTFTSTDHRGMKYTYLTRVSKGGKLEVISKPLTIKLD